MPTNSTENTRRGLSTRESKALARLAGQGERIVSIGDFEEVLDIPYKSAKDLVYSLKEKGWLERLVRGRYLLLPLVAGEEGVYTEHEFVIASHLADPMYVGYWTAMNHHGLTEQVPRTVYVVTTERAKTREIHDVTYRIVTVSEKKFFGHQPMAIENYQVNVASVEKTLADCADHPEHCGGIHELSKAIKRADEQGCSWETVIEHLDEIENGAATKRVVYVADQLGISLPDYRQIVDNFTSGYPLLDPTREPAGRRDSKYQLRLNVAPESFLPDEFS